MALPRLETDPQPGDRCPRCGAGFHCGIAGPGPCACTTLVLSPDRLAALAASYEGCLCLACLRELAAGAGAGAASAEEGARPRA